MEMDFTSGQIIAHTMGNGFKTKWMDMEFTRIILVWWFRDILTTIIMKELRKMMTNILKMSDFHFTMSILFCIFIITIMLYKLSCTHLVWFIFHTYIKKLIVKYSSLKLPVPYLINPKLKKHYQSNWWEKDKTSLLI